MRYWFSVHLPLLPLESVRPRWCEPAPFAVLDKGKVISVSREAYAAGVRVGMRPGGVSAVSPATTILERDLQREKITLNAVALALLQFTPEVAHMADFSILLGSTNPEFARALIELYRPEELNAYPAPKSRAEKENISESASDTEQRVQSDLF